MPTHYPVGFDAAKLDKDALLAPDILPTFSVASFTAKGAVLEGPALAHTGPLALVELQNGDAPPQYVAGTENFYVITRYNWSSYYAMAVIELGREVKSVVGGLAAMAPSAPQDTAPTASESQTAPSAPVAPLLPLEATPVTPVAPVAPAVSQPEPPAPAAPVESPPEMQGATPKPSS